MRNTYASALPKVDMVRTAEGGLVHKVSHEEALRRFLILGTIGGTFYADERKHTEDAIAVVTAALDANPVRMFELVAEVSLSGNAVSNEPAIVALCLGMASKLQNTRDEAYKAYRLIVRTGADHLMAFELIMGGKETAPTRKSSMGWRRVLREWYQSKSPDDLAYQLVKYQSRGDADHARVLRMARPNPVDPVQSELFRMATKGFLVDPEAIYPAGMPKIITGYLLAHYADVRITPTRAAQIVAEYRLTREMIPSEWLQHREVWEALLIDMPITAMIRNLGVMSSKGLFDADTSATNTVVARLTDLKRLRNGRVHPVSILKAWRTYSSGHGLRGGLLWPVSNSVNRALEDAFYLSFRALDQVNGVHMHAVDSSGSMQGGSVFEYFVPAELSVVMAMVAARTSPGARFFAFDTVIKEIDLKPGASLSEALQAFGRFGGGGTNCALPFDVAKRLGSKFDSVVVYTDGETATNGASATARDLYRQHGTRSAGVSMVPNWKGSLLPDERGFLNLMGFDTSTPVALASFVRGDV